MKCETVKVQHKDGYALINKSDFNEKEHKLFVEEEKPAKKAVKKPAKKAK